MPDASWPMPVLRMRSATTESSTDLPETRDAFHRGRFWLLQPKGRGHRSGTDAMMLAAAVPSGFAGHLADLGAGAGAAGLAVAARCTGARVTLVERDGEMVEFARRSLLLKENADLARRADILQADVTLAGRTRIAAGLADNRFGFAIMNPPFNDVRDRATDDSLRRAAHVMDAGLIEAWVRTAVAIVRPRGGFAAILRPHLLTDLLASVDGRFGALRIKPILPRPGQDAARIVVRGERGSRATLRIASPLVLHQAQGNSFTEEAEAVNNGAASLFAD